MTIFASNSSNRQDAISSIVEEQPLEDQEPAPSGELSLRLIPGRQDTNIHGGISGG